MPRLHLAIDNCFASKRWTKPDEWAACVRSLGLRCVEASADTEHDPLYNGAAYCERWINEVRQAEQRHGIEVVNLYSGHGTYSTLGLGHTDRSVAERMRDEWVKKMVDAAALLDAGLGFYAHAHPLSVLENPASYAAAQENLTALLADCAAYAASRMSRPIAVEQMYSPHQVPWTIAGAREFLSAIAKSAGHPMYLTIDVGHQCGQSRFQKPGREGFLKAVEEMKCGRWNRIPWLGPKIVYDLAAMVARESANPATAWDEAARLLPAYDYLFAAPEDGDPYVWLAEFAPYTPIIHLQQTDGRSSAHRPFTAEQNQTGIIVPGRVIEAIAQGYRRLTRPPNLPPVEDIYLTLEMFFPTAAHPYAALEELRESVAYWRKAIPEDGIALDEARALSSGER